MWRGRDVCVAVGVSAALALSTTVTAVPASAADERDAGTAVTNVKVLGQTLVTQGQQGDSEAAVASVHGVRRVKGGTVLYFSIGYPKDLPTRPIGGADLWPIWFAYDRYGLKAQPRGVSVIDPKGRKVYEPLLVSVNGACLCSWDRNISTQLGDVSVLYVVVPELPPDVTTVDVRLGFGSIVPGVPVETGALTPAKPADDRTVLLGQDWPAVDVAAVARSFHPERAIYPLVTRQGSTDGAIHQASGSSAVTLDLSADVLFSVDSAMLGARGRAVVAKAAQALNAKARTGTVRVVGYTDSDGSYAHNDTLSRDRAKSVAAALKPLLAGNVALTVDGRGETEPVATNTTAEGKRLNRRVAITSGTKG